MFAKRTQVKMAELNKSAFHTEEFHCLDFLLLDAMNELCNLLQFYSNIYTLCLLELFIFIVVFIHVFC